MSMFGMTGIYIFMLIRCTMVIMMMTMVVVVVVMMSYYIGALY